MKLNKIFNFDLSNNKNKIETVNSIKSFCKFTTANIKNEIIKSLITICKINPSVNASKNYELMTWKDLRVLSENPLFTIGGHTLYHDIMSKQSSDLMELDIKKTLSLLRINLNKNITHFSYPEGQKHHYNKKVITSLKKMELFVVPLQ